jgi:cell division protein FtsL
MKIKQVYSSQNIITLVAVFLVLFFLLYAIGKYLHESSKIQAEIEEIKNTNKKLAQELEDKKVELKYLQTPQRLEKEAKMQLGKKLPGEKVIVFVEEKPEILLPTEIKQIKRKKIKEPEVENWKKWQWVFFHKN